MTLTSKFRLTILFAAVASLAALSALLLSLNGAPAQAQDGSVPAQPSGLSTEAFYNYVDLTWDDPEDNSITHYQVLRRDRDVHDTGEFVTIESDTKSKATSYTDDTVEPEKRYVYRVVAAPQPTPEPTPAPTPEPTPEPTPAPTPEPTPEPTPAATPEPNTPATGAPTISGTVQVGETLTADTSGIADADGLGNAVFEYQWIAEDTEVAGATSSTYTPVDADVGKTIKVRVSFIDGNNNQEALTSEPTASVAPGSGPLVGFTVVNASDQIVVEILTHGGALVLDDPDNGSYGIRADVETDAEIGSLRLQLTGAEDVDKTENLAPYSLYGDSDGNLNGQALPTGQYTLTATAYAERRLEGVVLGTLEVSFTVTETAAEEEVQNSPATGVPTISGTARVGQTLEAFTNGISDADGLDDVAYSYQWLADNADIAGAMGKTYTLVAADQGTTITVRVTFDDDANNEESLTSVATASVAAASVPAAVEEAPAFAERGYVFVLAENTDGSTNRVSLGTVAATDQEGAALSYSIEGGNASGLFGIDAASGELFYTGAGEDFEAGAGPFELTVQASDGDLATHTIVVVTVRDVQEAPAFAEQSYAFDLEENSDGSATRVSLGTVAATDQEGAALSYSIEGGNAAGLFEIDAASGELFYTGAGEDFEAGTGPFELTVRASDGDLSMDTAVTVSVTDVQEAPKSVSEPDGEDFSANNSTDGRVAVGDSATGDIGTPRDRDWFARRAGGGRGIQVRPEGQPDGRRHAVRSRSARHLQQQREIHPRNDGRRRRHGL